MAIIAELSWDDVASGHFPHTDTPARKAFREAVEAVAQKARKALPEANGRIDAAVKIVLQGDVDILPEGKAKVASQSNGTTKYFIVNGTCDCKDFPKAPQGFCKHRLSAALYKRSTTLAKQKLEQLDGNHNGHLTSAQHTEAPQATAPVAIPLPEAPASANVYVTLAGRKVQMTLRDSDEQRLLERLETLLQRFPAEEEPEPTTPPEGWCPIHHVQMKYYTKNHKSWWSHRLNTGAWCRGK
jgi:hypothetical protein